MDLDNARSSWSQRVADLLLEFGIIDLVWHFRQRCRFQDLKTWTQVKQVTVPCLRCNHILGKDRNCLELGRIINMCNFTSDHFEIRARLLIHPT